MAGPADPHPEEPEGHPKSLRARIARIQAQVKKDFPGSSEPFDMKAFMDEAWEWPHGDFSKTDIELVAPTDEDERSC